MRHTHQVLGHLWKLAVVIGTAGLLACEDPFISKSLVLGFIDFDNTVWPLPRIPETATAGVPLTVTVWTGHHGCGEHAFTDTGVADTGQGGYVTPRDYLTLTDGVGCAPGDLEFIAHTATFVFDEPGTAEIRLTYSTKGGSNPEDHGVVGRKVYTVAVAEADNPTGAR